MKSRTRARSVALQALYEIDITNHPPGEVVDQRLGESTLEPGQAEFVRQIVTGVVPLFAISVANARWKCNCLGN